MNLLEAKNYIDNVTKKGSILGLDTTKELLLRLGNPEAGQKFVHIAGTNGKGSTLAYISQILKDSGYRVGRYISPVLFSYNEKIQVNGESISDEKLVKLVEKVKAASDSMIADNLPAPTIFELETAMAFLYFKEENCDIAVIEVGMGGKDDSTNVIPYPLVSVIMSISLDHVGVIGNNLTEIAMTKAGIIKNGSDTVLYSQGDEVTTVIKETCKENNVPLTITDPSSLEIKTSSILGQTFSYKEIKDIEIKLPGIHQIKNACAAIETALILNNKGFSISTEQIKEGLKNTIWPGRFEVISYPSSKGTPFVIMDGAHNPDGASTFRACVDEYLKDNYKIFIFGVLADKDYPKIIETTCDAADEIITVNPGNARALSDETLAKSIHKLCQKKLCVTAAGMPEAGFDLAALSYQKHINEKPVIVIFGSLSFLGKLKKHILA